MNTSKGTRAKTPLGVSSLSIFSADEIRELIFGAAMHETAIQVAIIFKATTSILNFLSTALSTRPTKPIAARSPLLSE
jgi:hypothetical protein